ncbi:hypothetical protein H0H92_013203 [Tricholoma furcatifolium]|nr:hypothetical protein H0H92_013203 [Tricholoma furcatifolium]
MDFNSSSGWNTPRRVPTNNIEASQADFTSLWARKADRFSRSRNPEAQRLEDKVAKVAAKKCSVEEVSLLHRELEEWLKTSEEGSDQTALLLSAALLRAILMNHLTNIEVNRNLKDNQNNLKSKVEELQINNEKMDSELRKCVHSTIRQQYATKAQDYQTVWTELNRLKGTLGIPVDARQSATSPTPPPTSPTPHTSPSSQSPLSSRFTSMHQRSASMSSRPTTPATPTPSRTYTPAPPLPRMQTPAPPLSRAQTPLARAYTPAPATLRSMTQTPSLMRHTTPAPPPVPTKPRRLSTPSPPKMMRSTSEEKGEYPQIWMPPSASEAPFPARAPSRSATRTPYTTASSRYSPAVAR